MTTADRVREQLREENPEALFCDGYDTAIVGVGRRCAQPPLVVYSVQKYIDALVAGGMTEGEAHEFFEFNVAGAWMGPHTPLFLYLADDAGA